MDISVTSVSMNLDSVNKDVEQNDGPSPTGRSRTGLIESNTIVQLVKANMKIGYEITRMQLPSSMDLNRQTMKRLK